MPTAKLLTRVELLEQRVTVLEMLPAKVDALATQIVQLRDEMRAEFSAIRAEMRTGDLATQGSLREEIRGSDEETRRVLREEIRAGDEETRRVLREEIRAGDEETRRVLREEIRGSEDLMRELNRETRAHMLALHEDLVERIKRIGEALVPAAPPQPRPRKR